MSDFSKTPAKSPGPIRTAGEPGDVKPLRFRRVSGSRVCRSGWCSSSLLALAHQWETRALGGSGFMLELDTTWLTAARELRELVAVVTLLEWVGRQSRITRTRV